MVLTDITNRVFNSKKDHVKQMHRKETLQKENMLFSSRDFAEKLQKANMTLLKALAHERKRSELGSIAIQKLRINLRSVQENNLQLAQANSQMLAERNTNRARLKELQHELACKNASLKVKKQPEEHVQVEEQLKDSANVQETEQTQKFLEVEDAKETARLPLRRRSARLIKRRASGVIDTSVIPEETARLPLRRRSARLRSKEAEPCKSFHEGDEVRDTIKRRRLSSTKKSARFDFEVPEVTETLNADDARRASGVIDTTEQDQVQQNEKRRRRRQIELNTTDSEISSKGSSSNERNGEDVTEQITSSAQGKKDDCSSKDLYNSGGENMPLIEETEQPEEDQGKLEVGTDKVIDEVGASEDGERVPVENFQDAEDDKDDETAKDQTRVSTGPRKEGEQDQQRTTKVVAESKTVRDISFFKDDQKRKIFWTMEEEEMLKVGVEKFAPEVNKNIPWRKILKMGEEVFHKTRTPADLKDKWRRTW